MALPACPFAPHSPNYTANIGVGAVVATQLDGGGGRYRRDYLGSTAKIQCEWVLSPEDYTALYDFYHATIFDGSLPFNIDVVFQSATIQTYKAYILPDTFVLYSQEGLSYTVHATIEAFPNDIGGSGGSGGGDLTPRFGEIVTFTARTGHSAFTVRLFLALYRNGQRLNVGISNDFTLGSSTFTLNFDEGVDDVFTIDYWS